MLVYGSTSEVGRTIVDALRAAGVEGSPVSDADDIAPLLDLIRSRRG